MKIDTLILAIATGASLAACMETETTTLTDEEMAAKMAEADAAIKSVPDLSAVWTPGCRTAFLKGMSSQPSDNVSVPWLTIYDADGRVIDHGEAYIDPSVDIWQRLLDDDTRPSVSGPSLEYAANYAQFDPADIPASDYVFVKYSADWCAPCKLQSRDLQSLKTANPDLKIAHVEIDIDAVSKADDSAICDVADI
ncbi:thioredoxin family protein [uncultured Algimonas sp.]|uniref:thioredoxin family protein n=1 Tax=uncultured Algimonas sp. TaxID=1547920 RepID=UPI002628416E|nr:thioredoxin family protein [uncultured Algimonas sp.]